MQFKTKGHVSASVLHKQCFYFATCGSGKCTQQQLVVIVASRPAESGKLAHTVQSGARGPWCACAVVSRIFEDNAQNLCTRHYYWASPRSNDTQLMQVALPGTQTKKERTALVKDCSTDCHWVPSEWTSLQQNTNEFRESSIVLSATFHKFVQLPRMANCKCPAKQTASHCSKWRAWLQHFQASFWMYIMNHYVN